MLITPGGNPASFNIWATMCDDNGAFSLVFKMIVFPAARAGASFLLRNTSGAFHGMIAATTPYGYDVVNIM